MLAEVMPIMNCEITVEDLSLEGGEPRIKDLRLAEALGFKNIHIIRTLIKRHLDSLRCFAVGFSHARETYGERRAPRRGL